MTDNVYSLNCYSLKTYSRWAHTKKIRYKEFNTQGLISLPLHKSAFYIFSLSILIWTKCEKIRKGKEKKWNEQVLNVTAKQWTKLSPHNSEPCFIGKLTVSVRLGSSTRTLKPLIHQNPTKYLRNLVTWSNTEDLAIFNHTVIYN